MAFQLKAKVISNKRVKSNYFRCVLAAPRIADEACCGQFINIKVSLGDHPLLRRPFSICRVDANNLEMLYEVVGEATKILSEQKTGGYLDIIGPLGEGFDYRSQSHQVTKSPVLVAGGIGVAPLLFLAEKLAHKRPLVLIGAKTKKEILCEKEFKDMGCKVKISTDDGSRGFKGRVTGLLEDLLSTIDDGLSTIYACGPRPMLKEISALSKKYRIPAQVSLDEHMACGIGACLGCVVKTKEGYKRVCKEGPVFNAKEVVW